MKNRIVFFLLGLATTLAASFGRPSHISAGRQALVNEDIVTADQSFAAALALDPANAEANALRSVTRLLAISKGIEFNAFLDRLGVSRLNRDVYHWRASLPKDPNGFYLPPEQVSSQELPVFLVSLLPQLTASEANLERISDVNFILNLSSNETKIAAVTLDYGDILMLKAILHANEYLILTFGSLNLDAQLAEIRQVYLGGTLNFETILAGHPEALNYITTNNLSAAQFAFSKGADDYILASNFIRNNRSPKLERLFNLDPKETRREEKFRQTLADLKTSLSFPVRSTSDTNLTFSLFNLFSGTTNPRDFLPKAFANGFIAGSLPDPTFGGVITGVAGWKIEKALSTASDKFQIRGYPNLSLQVLPDRSFRLNAAAITGRKYILEATSPGFQLKSFESWLIARQARATNGLVSFILPPPLEPYASFRVADLAGTPLASGLSKRTTALGTHGFQDGHPSRGYAPANLNGQAYRLTDANGTGSVRFTSATTLELTEPASATFATGIWTYSLNGDLNTVPIILTDEREGTLTLNFDTSSTAGHFGLSLAGETAVSGAFALITGSSTGGAAAGITARTTAGTTSGITGGNTPLNLTGAKLNFNVATGPFAGSSYDVGFTASNFIASNGSDGSGPYIYVISEGNQAIAKMTYTFPVNVNGDSDAFTLSFSTPGAGTFSGQSKTGGLEHSASGSFRVLTQPTNP